MKRCFSGLLVLCACLGASDEFPLKLNVASPRAGASTGPLELFRFSVLKSDFGVQPGSVSVIVNFPVNGEPAGTELFPFFSETDEDVWTLPLASPIASLSDGHIVVQIKDRAGNVSTLDRWFNIGSGYLPPAISVVPGLAVLRAAGARQFSATGGPVKWSIAPHLGTISPSGLYVAPPSVGAAETITITATSTADPAQFGTAQLKIEPAL